ncbi:uncharacterized protein Tco025E_01881 [Trypanosoma conorhini]|uniref:Uncharacterized protein n=1 Tax=Trypanosoma conorhini TaxID=83891 RepID=A0A422Q7D2_9TRYP|nr:uncharacterized protein Tco025E_01881 [Trypanosoma conorhini]RNF25876.1 hypothetical protein Tco025E_01881 [Trypanosoma conorhini]
MPSVGPLEGAGVEGRQGAAPGPAEAVEAGGRGPSGRPAGAAPHVAGQLPYVLGSAGTCAVPLSEALESALCSTVEALAAAAAEAEGNLLNACAPPPPPR